MLVRKTMNRKSSKSGAPARKSSPGKDAAVQSGTFPVVAIGASAGGLEAYKEFFQALPSGTGMAFVVVQHLDPSHHSMLTEIIAKSTAMPVEEVKSGDTNKAGLRVCDSPERFHVNFRRHVYPDTAEQRTKPASGSQFLHALAGRELKARVRSVLFFPAPEPTAHWASKTLRRRAASPSLRSLPRPGTTACRAVPLTTGAWISFCRPKDIAKEIERIRRHPYLLANKETNADRGKDLEDAVAPAGRSGRRI